MNDVLVRIKRAVLAGRYVFSEKAHAWKWRRTVLRNSTWLRLFSMRQQFTRQFVPRKQAREYLYVIQSTNLDGVVIYSKGKLVREAGAETYYFLISSKKAIISTMVQITTCPSCGSNRIKRMRPVQSAFINNFNLPQSTASTGRWASEG